MSKQVFRDANGFFKLQGDSSELPNRRNLDQDSTPPRDKRTKPTRTQSPISRSDESLPSISNPSPREGSLYGSNSTPAIPVHQVKNLRIEEVSNVPHIPNPNVKVFPSIRSNSIKNEQANYNDFNIKDSAGRPNPVLKSSPSLSSSKSLHNNNRLNESSRLNSDSSISIPTYSNSNINSNSSINSTISKSKPLPRNPLQRTNSSNQDDSIVNNQKSEKSRNASQHSLNQSYDNLLQNLDDMFQQGPPQSSFVQQTIPQFTSIQQTNPQPTSIQPQRAKVISKGQVEKKHNAQRGESIDDIYGILTDELDSVITQNNQTTSNQNTVNQINQKTINQNTSNPIINNPKRSINTQVLNKSNERIIASPLFEHDDPVSPVSNQTVKLSDAPLRTTAQTSNNPINQDSLPSRMESKKINNINPAYEIVDRVIESRPSVKAKSIVEVVSTPSDMISPFISHHSHETERSIPVDESIIVTDYILALVNILKSHENTPYIVNDFLSEEGYREWQSSINKTIPRVLIMLLRDRYIDKKPKEINQPEPTITLKFKVISASGLFAKEGKVRDAYATIEYGSHIEWDDSRKKENFFQTEVVQSNDPIWDQYLDIPCKNLSDTIMISVWDKRKDEFLGYTKVQMGDLVSSAVKSGYHRKRYSLNPRENKKDKYAGGFVVLEASVYDKETSKPNDPILFLQRQFISCKIRFTSLYKVLLVNCMLLDIGTMDVTDKTADLLSEESKMLMRVYSKIWGISEAFHSIALLDTLFQKYQSYQVPTNAVLAALETIYSMKKKIGSITGSERPILLELLERMFEHYKKQIIKYRDFYPKNQPKGALEKTIFMLRIVHKNPIFKEAHPELPESFSGELRGIMSQACENRYDTLYEFNAPIDDTNTMSVIEGLTLFATTLSTDIDTDDKYFVEPFHKELNITRLTAGIYLNQLSSTIQSNIDKLETPDIVQFSPRVFEFYKTLVKMKKKYSNILLENEPKSKKLNSYSNQILTIEKWFSEFMNNWLDYTNTKTREWVSNALKADTFEPSVEGENLMHSTSIRDLFQMVLVEVQVLIDLEWEDVVQKASYFQKMSCTIYQSIDLYCENISVGEIKTDPQSSWSWSKTLKTSDVAVQSCIKLCNMEFAVTELDRLYKIMNASSLIRTQKENRSIKTHSSSDYVSGMLRVHVAYAENIKGVNKNGLCNPYVVIRVPENTPIPLTLEDRARNLAGNSKPGRLLTGKNCELLRSFVVYDSIYPSWEEGFECVVPPVPHLELIIYSKNLLTFDDLVGTAIIDLRPGSRLSQKLVDFQTYDIYIELDPQGRLLLRLSLDGEDENIDFWFRKSRERLARVRDDIGRTLVNKISPFSKEFIQKSIKENEATLAGGFFGSLTGAIQLTNQTSQGISVDLEYNLSQVDLMLEPLKEFLNKNLSTLFSYLSKNLSQDVIKKKWDLIVLVVESLMVPNIHATVEKDRRILNQRQLSLLKWTLKVLFDFFHADGDGLSTRSLQTPKYSQVIALNNHYNLSIPLLKSEFESSFRDGREKMLYLRLIRLKYEKMDLSLEEREAGRVYIQNQLDRIKEKRG